MQCRVLVSAGNGFTFRINGVRVTARPDENGIVELPEWLALEMAKVKAVELVVTAVEETLPPPPVKKLEPLVSDVPPPPVKRTRSPNGTRAPNRSLKDKLAQRKSSVRKPS